MLPTFQILAKIKDKYEKGILTNNIQVYDTLKKAFGSDEAVKFIKNNIDKVDMLAEKTVYLDKITKERVQVTQKMAQLVNRDNVTQIARIRAENMLLSIGKVLFPLYSAILEVFGDLMKDVGSFFSKFDRGLNIVDKLSHFVQKNKALFKWIMLIVGGLSAFMVVAKGIGFVLSSVLIPVLSTFATISKILKQALKLLRLETYKNIWAWILQKKALIANKTAMAKNIAVRVALAVWNGILAAKTWLVTIATWAFSAALWANPITWVVAGIVALIAVIVLLIVYWEDIVKWVQSSWDSGW